MLNSNNFEMEKCVKSSLEVSGDKETGKEGFDELLDEVTSQIKQSSVQSNRNVDEGDVMGEAVAVAGGDDLGVFPEEVLKLLNFRF